MPGGPGRRLRQRKNPDYCLRHNSEPTLRAEDPAPRVANPNGFAWGYVRPFKCAPRGDDRDVKHQVLDVSVAILLHAAGVSRDPAAECRELDAVRLVAHRESVFRKLLDDMSSYGARLDTGHAIFGIDPQNTIHSAHINRHNQAFFLLGAAQCIADVRAATVRDQTHVVILGSAREVRHLIMCCRVDNQVGDALNVAVLNAVHLLLRLAVTVTKPRLGIVADLVGVQEAANFRDKCIVDAGLGNWRWVIGRVQVVPADVRMDRIPNPA